MSVDSTMATPDVVDEVGITLMTRDGNVFYSNTVDLRVAGRLPPLDLGVAPSAGPIRAIAVGFRAGAPKVFREAIGTAPDTALQLLQVGLDWENWGSATLEAIPGVGTSADVVHLAAESTQGRTRVYFKGRSVRSACAAEMTPLGGICASAIESNLAEYSEDLERGGPDRRCFDTDACMAGGYTLVQPLAVGKVCTVQLSPDLKKWVTDSGENFNVAVEGEAAAGVTRLMASTQSRDKTRLDGWWFDKESGRLSLPLTFCAPDPAWAMPAVGSASTATTYDWVWTGPKRVVLSTRCKAKKRSLPICQKGTSLKPADVKPDQGAMPVVLNVETDFVKKTSYSATANSIESLLDIDIDASLTAVGIVTSSQLAVQLGAPRNEFGAQFFLHQQDSGMSLEVGGVLKLPFRDGDAKSAPFPARIAAAGDFLVASASAAGAGQNLVRLVNAGVGLSSMQDCRSSYLRLATVLPNGAVYLLRDVRNPGAELQPPTWSLTRASFTTDQVCDSSSAENIAIPPMPDTPKVILVKPSVPPVLGFASKTLVRTNAGADHILPAGQSVVHAAYSPDGAWVDVVSVENEADPAARRFAYWPMRADAPASMVDKPVSLAVQGPPMAALYKERDSNLHSAPNMIAALGDKVYFVEANPAGPRLIKLSRDLSAVETFELRGFALAPWSLAALADPSGAVRVYFAGIAADKKSFELSHVVLPK